MKPFKTDPCYSRQGFVRPRIHLYDACISSHEVCPRSGQHRRLLTSCDERCSGAIGRSLCAVSLEAHQSAEMVDKKRNGGPRNLKTILKREKKAKERNQNTGSKRRKLCQPVRLSDKDPSTRIAFQQIEKRVKREQKEDPGYDSRTAVMTFIQHRRRCNSGTCRHTYTSREARDEELDKYYEKEECDCYHAWYWLSKDDEIPPCKHGKKQPDTGDESGIESAGFDSTRSVSC